MHFFKRLYLGAIYLFLYLPIFILILYSFNDSKYSVEWTGFTWKWYEKVLENDALLEAAFNSISIATLSALPPLFWEHWVQWLFFVINLKENTFKIAGVYFNLIA